jgi:hypothetical protein
MDLEWRRNLLTLWAHCASYHSPFLSIPHPCRSLPQYFAWAYVCWVFESFCFCTAQRRLVRRIHIWKLSVWWLFGPLGISSSGWLCFWTLSHGIVIGDLKWPWQEESFDILFRLPWTIPRPWQFCCQLIHCWLDMCPELRSVLPSSLGNQWQRDIRFGLEPADDYLWYSFLFSATTIDTVDDSLM